MISLDVTAPEAAAWHFEPRPKHVDWHYSTGQAGFVAIPLRRVKGWRYTRISYLSKPCQMEQSYYRCLRLRSAIECHVICARQSKINTWKIRLSTTVIRHRQRPSYEVQL
jgi:hypothetical protein